MSLLIVGRYVELPQPGANFRHQLGSQTGLDGAIIAHHQLVALLAKEAQLGTIRILYTAGSLSEAAVRLDALLARRPGDAPARLLYTRVALAEGNAAAARTHYRQAVEASPILRDPLLEKDLFPEGLAGPAPTPPSATSAGLKRSAAAAR